jgi:hypothetical protein
MKTKHAVTVQCIRMLFLFCGGIVWTNAQEPAGYYTVSGTVKDVSNKKRVEHVNVSAAGTNIGTITNEDGEFSLKLPNASQVKEIKLSCIGYYNARISISGKNRPGQIFYITPQSVHLSEVEVFSWQNPRDLVKAALSRIDRNYSMTPNLLTGFYRETVQKRRKYIQVSEAVVQIYKDSYGKGIETDRVQILKGRKLVSPKAGDTLSVKLLGGPNMSVYIDIVKNPELLLEEEAMPYYEYRMGETALINDRLQYVVHFQPQVALLIPLYAGTFYIDRETLAFTRAEFGMDMKDKRKVTAVILKEKPAGLRFSPEEVSYTVTYRQQNGKTYLNYIRNDIRFKCDWKRKLFATNYTVTGETVVTDNREDHVPKIPAKDAFSIKQSLSQEVAAYYDDDFWGAYNIIEPTESLENAVNKLKKQQRISP